MKLLKFPKLMPIIQIDGDIHIIRLRAALASQDLYLRSKNGRLIISQRKTNEVQQ